jgi:hypothetical protein
MNAADDETQITSSFENNLKLSNRNDKKIFLHLFSLLDLKNFFILQKKSIKYK